LWSISSEATGLAVGIPSAMALGRFVSSRLYGIEGRDPWTAVATLILLTAVSAAAGVIPAHRASRIDPILALRYE
jgi:ABC-type lipoprotein release transport system permease subunit